MKQKEFSHLFPHADTHKFKSDYDGTMVFIDDDSTLIDVESQAFFDDYSNAKYLNLPNIGLSWWRDNHYEFLNEWRRAYNYRSLKDDDLFPLKYTYVKPKTAWGPAEWNSIRDYNVPAIPSTFITLGKLFSGSIPNVSFEKFRIYVDGENFFMLNTLLPWNFTNVKKADFTDPKNEYCLSLKSMYVLSYLGGISLENLQSENNLAKSLAHFYLYYHLVKFYNYRDFSIYDISELEKHNWPLNTQGRFTLSKGKYTKKGRGFIFAKDSRLHIDADGIWFDRDRKKRNLTKDYLNLLLKNSNGISNIGQRLLQESCQAYVYCILGAQAKTRWKIVGDSANSLQTQYIFNDLVSEVTKQNNIHRAKLQFYYTLIKSVNVVKGTFIILNNAIKCE